MSDVFHESVPVSFIREIFDIMAECSWHTFQVLTKRPKRAIELAEHLPWPENIWLGTSIESHEVVERARLLQEIPAKVRFLSCEPLIGPLPRLPLRGIHWVIVGGESGPRSRTMEKDWVMQVKDQCDAKGVSFFFKQWGGANKKAAGRHLNGRTYDAFPQVKGIISNV